MDNIKQSLREMALFAGAGGGILGGKLLGWRTVCAVEWTPYAAAVLCARQNEGILENFPIWDDVQTFDGNPWRGIIDVVSGGFPCQDISCAGKGAGITGERSGMWKHMARIIGEVRPRYTFVENSPMLTLRGLDAVLSDLAQMGYNAKWGIVSAADAGAPHLRERIWIRGTLCDASMHGCTSTEIGKSTDERGHDRAAWKGETRKFKGSNRECGELADAYVERCKKRNISPEPCHVGQFAGCDYSPWWTTDPGDEIESGMGRMAHGMAFVLDRLTAIGNGQVPMAAALAWEMLT